MGHATHQRGKRKDCPHNYEVHYHHYCKKEKREKRKENHGQDVEELEEGAKITKMMLRPEPRMTILSYFGTCLTPIFLTIFQNFLQLISYSRFYSGL